MVVKVRTFLSDISLSIGSEDLNISNTTTTFYVSHSHLLVFFWSIYSHHCIQVKSPTAHMHPGGEYHFETVYDTTTRWHTFPACFRHCQTCHCAWRNYYVPTVELFESLTQFLCTASVVWNEGLCIYLILFILLLWNHGKTIELGAWNKCWKMHNIIDVWKYLYLCCLLNCCVPGYLQIKWYIHILLCLHAMSVTLISLGITIWTQCYKHS